MSDVADLDDFIQGLDAEGKVCLAGHYWDKLFTIATGSHKRDNSVLPNPLILAGWWASDDDEKSERFRLHLKHGHENGRWKELIDYISTVPKEAWHYVSGKNI